MQFSEAVDLAAFLPRLLEKINLSFVFAGPRAQRVLQPAIKPTRMNPQGRHIIRAENCRRCRAMNAYFTCTPGETRGRFLGCRAPR